MPSFSLLKFLLILTLLCSLIGCGGGSSNKSLDFEGAANIRLTATPNIIDTGDRTLVKINIENVISDGVILKVRFPERLTYVKNSAKLEIKGKKGFEPITPSFIANRDELNYIVFFLSRDFFGVISEDPNQRSEPGILYFQLVANGKVDNGRIESDADVNDPEVDDSLEFQIENPMFDTETEASIQVKKTDD